MIRGVGVHLLTMNAFIGMRGLTLCVSLVRTVPGRRRKALQILQPSHFMPGLQRRHVQLRHLKLGVYKLC
jgi:hypothetical protein